MISIQISLEVSLSLKTLGESFVKDLFQNERRNGKFSGQTGTVIVTVLNSIN